MNDLLERLVVFGVSRLLTAQEIQDLLSEHHVELNISSTYEGHTHAAGIFTPVFRGGREEHYNGRGKNLTEAMNKMFLAYLLHNQPCQVLQAPTGECYIDKREMQMPNQQFIKQFSKTTPPDAPLIPPYCKCKKVRGKTGKVIQAIKKRIPNFS